MCITFGRVLQTTLKHQLATIQSHYTEQDHNAHAVTIANLILLRPSKTMGCVCDQMGSERAHIIQHTHSQPVLPTHLCLDARWSPAPHDPMSRPRVPVTRISAPSGLTAQHEHTRSPHWATRHTMTDTLARPVTKRSQTMMQLHGEGKNGYVSCCCVEQRWGDDEDCMKHQDRHLLLHNDTNHCVSACEEGHRE